MRMPRGIQNTRYLCACSTTARRSASVHSLRWVQSLSSVISISSSCGSSSWHRRAAQAAAAPRCLSDLSWLCPRRPGSNSGMILRLYSSSKTSSQDSKETVPLNKRDPIAPMKTSNDDTIKEMETPGGACQRYSWRQRAKTFALEYGRVGVCTHIVLSVLFFSSIYVGVSSGVDVKAILDSIGVSTSVSTNSAGSVIIAYTLYKVMVPIRWAVTFAVTPVVLRALRRRGYMLATTNSPLSPPPPPPQ